MKKKGMTRREFVKGWGAAIGVMSATGLSPVLNLFAAEQKADGPQTNFLAVPGARLYYEIRGSGPLLIMVPGANGDARIFKGVSEPLAGYYTVVTYDRRGFSRSRLLGRQDYSRRIETEAEDVRDLIQHLSQEPATVFGSSSGGIIALKVLIHYPALVRRLITFEPAAVKLLPDGQKWLDFFLGIYDLYRRSGVEPALKMFREQAFAESDRQFMAGVPRSAHTYVNAHYWFEHELRQYPAVDLDLNSLKANAARIVLMAGRESRGYPCYEVNVELAKKLGLDLVELPGGHSGFASQPAEFAGEFLQALGRMGHTPKGK
ncbi:MAG: alpha/beta hydrolase [Deltaproteobacteria bacterium]|nr:alpha/beta hydrolase [Deltaproteobacteria bacterium]